MIPCGPRLDRHSTTPDAAGYYERAQSGGQPPSRAERAAEAGLDPTIGRPVPAHLELDDEWQAALDASLAEVRTIRAAAGAR